MRAWPAMRGDPPMHGAVVLTKKRSRRRVLRSGAVARQDTIPLDASAQHRHADQPRLRRDGQLSAHKSNSRNKKNELHEYRRPGQRTGQTNVTTVHPVSSSCDVADHRLGEIMPLQLHAPRFRMDVRIAENSQMRRPGPEAIGLRPPVASCDGDEARYRQNAKACQENGRCRCVC
jgi:hypothetical protein